MEDDPNAFLMGGGKTPSLSWRNAPVGKTYKGTVARASRVMDQRSVDTGEILYWDDAKTRPKKMLCVYLDTGVIDPTIEDHDGVWAWYVKGKSASDALRAAVRGSGRAGIEIGGFISVTFTGEGVASNRAFNPPKLFTVSYMPPADASVAMLGDESMARSTLAGAARSELAGIAQRQQEALRRSIVGAEPPF